MEFTNGLVECEFDEYLSDQLQLDEAERPRTSQWSRVGNTIGAMTLRLNLMSEAEVDAVLESQDMEGGFFGEIAVRDGYLTEDQVDQILELQQLHDQLNLAEQLVVAGKLDVASLVKHLSVFLSDRGSRT